MDRSPAAFAVAVALLATLLAGCLDPGATRSNGLAEVADPRAALHIVVHAQPGLALEPQAMEDWLAVVREVRGGEVVVSQGRGIGPDEHSSFDEMYDLADQLWSEAGIADASTVHLPLFLMQKSDPEGLAGLTVYETSSLGRRAFTAIFMASLHDATYFPLGEPLPSPLPPPSPAPGPELLMQVQRAVLVHEFGHALGLVGCGIPEVSPHQAADRPCHSDNDESVMWYILHNTEDLRKYILEDGFSPVWTFDGDDLADIRSAQETLLAGGTMPRDWD